MVRCVRVLESVCERGTRTARASVPRGLARHNVKTNTHRTVGGTGPSPRRDFYAGDSAGFHRVLLEGGGARQRGRGRGGKLGAPATSAAGGGAALVRRLLIVSLLFTSGAELPVGAVECFLENTEEPVNTLGMTEHVACVEWSPHVNVLQASGKRPSVCSELVRLIRLRDAVRVLRRNRSSRCSVGQKRLLLELGQIELICTRHSILPRWPKACIDLPRKNCRTASSVST